MVTTITLNPCIDYSITVPGFHMGALNLADKTRMDASGKGVNVALVLKALGVPCQAAGISFCGNHSMLAERLKENGIVDKFVLADGNIRTNVKLYDSQTKTMTELNSLGDKIDAAALDNFYCRLEELVPQSEMVVLSGRIPNGAPAGIYQDILNFLHQYPVKTVLDADGDAMRLGILAKPYLIKPNDYELGLLAGRKLESKTEMVKASREIIAQGVSVVCVSLGCEGALIVDGTDAIYARGLDIPVCGLQGAGDSMVAGMCKAILEHRPITDVLRYGMAASAGSVIREGTLLCQKEDFETFLSQIEVEIIGL